MTFGLACPSYHFSGISDAVSLSKAGPIDADFVVNGNVIEPDPNDSCPAFALQS
jgi:hypothetical protein